MKILLDECVPRPFKSHFSRGEHQCSTVQEAGFAGLLNGELLRMAERNFDVFVTLDKGIQYQQNLSGFQIAVLIIRAKSSRIEDILPHIPACLVAIRSIKSANRREWHSPVSIASPRFLPARLLVRRQYRIPLHPLRATF